MGLGRERSVVEGRRRRRLCLGEGGPAATGARPRCLGQTPAGLSAPDPLPRTKGGGVYGGRLRRATRESGLGGGGRGRGLFENAGGAVVARRGP